MTPLVAWRYSEVLWPVPYRPHQHTSNRARAKREYLRERIRTLGPGNPARAESYHYEKNARLQKQGEGRSHVRAPRRAVMSGYRVQSARLRLTGTPHLQTARTCGGGRRDSLKES